MKGTENDDSHAQYYHARTSENAKFWTRLGGMPDFKGRTVLEIGSGTGYLSIEIALSGARKVVGIDINREVVDFANRYLQKNHPQLREVVEFAAMDLKEYDPQARFDFVISYSTFEHVIDLEGMMAEATRRLVPGGRVYFGFGPLYNSPYGDHKWTNAVIPWGHLIFPERILLKKINSGQSKKMASIKELGLNQWSAQQYMKLFRNCGLVVVWLKANKCEDVIPRIFSLLGNVPKISEFFTFNIYGILEKPLGR